MAKAEKQRRLGTQGSVSSEDTLLSEFNDSFKFGQSPEPKDKRIEVEALYSATNPSQDMVSSNSSLDNLYEKQMKAKINEQISSLEMKQKQ